MTITPGTVPVLAQPIGEERYGLWCCDCLKPSRVETDLMMLTPDGMSPFGVFSMCTDCGLPGTLDRDLLSPRPRLAVPPCPPLSLLVVLHPRLRDAEDGRDMTR